MPKDERIFFNKFVTKDLKGWEEKTKSGDDKRMFEGYLTVEMVDKQNEITIVDELMKVLPVWMSRGAPISDTHSNRIVGKGINYAKTYVTENGVKYPAIYIKGQIHDDYQLDNEIWTNIQTGKYKGLSFGGATKSDRIPVQNEDGTTSYALKDLEQYEVAVCEDPAVPLALITHFNPIAKALVKRNKGKYIQKNAREHVIKCYSFGCYVDKSWQDTKIVDHSPQAEGLPDKNGEHPDKKKDGEWSDTHGVNVPQIDDQKVERTKKKEPPKITAGNQKDPTGECFEAVPHSSGADVNPGVGNEQDSMASSQIGYTFKGDVENEAFKPNDEILGAAGKAEEEEDDKEKTLNPGENMNMEKPIRGLRGTGGMGGGGGGSAMQAGGKATQKALDEVLELTKDGTGIDSETYMNKFREILEKYDYDMSKIIDDPTVNDPRVEEDKKKLNTAPSLQASGGEDGVSNQQRVNVDPTAQGLQNDVDTTKTTVEKEIVYASGGTRGGSYEATDQDSQQWDARVTPTSDAKHTREVDHRVSGDKDSLNTINTAMKAIEDKMQAIEIRRAMKNL